MKIQYGFVVLLCFFITNCTLINNVDNKKVLNKINETKIILNTVLVKLDDFVSEHEQKKSEYNKDLALTLKEQTIALIDNLDELSVTISSKNLDRSELNETYKLVNEIEKDYVNKVVIDNMF